MWKAGITRENALAAILGFTKKQCAQIKGCHRVKRSAGMKINLVVRIYMDLHQR